MPKNGTEEFEICPECAGTGVWGERDNMTCAMCNGRRRVSLDRIRSYRIEQELSVPEQRVSVQRLRKLVKRLIGKLMGRDTGPYSGT
jgi:hypothetical protein